jgi:hypothetical protein
MHLVVKKAKQETYRGVQLIVVFINFGICDQWGLNFCLAPSHQILRVGPMCSFLFSVLYCQLVDGMHVTLKVREIL